MEYLNGQLDALALLENENVHLRHKLRSFQAQVDRLKRDIVVEPDPPSLDRAPGAASTIRGMSRSVRVYVC